MNACLGSILSYSCSKFPEISMIFLSLTLNKRKQQGHFVPIFQDLPHKSISSIQIDSLQMTKWTWGKPTIFLTSADLLSLGSSEVQKILD